MLQFVILFADLICRAGGDDHAPFAFGNPFMSIDVLKPINSLPLLIFNYAISPYPEWHSLAWGASLILVMFVLLLNLIAKMVAKRWKVQF